MAKVLNVEPIVKEVLLFNTQARKDDYILYEGVLSHYVNTKNISLQDVFVNHLQYKLPSIESISRCRRKLQKNFPELKDFETSEIRYEEEQEFRAYAKD